MIEFLNQISPLISAIATVVIAIYAIFTHIQTKRVIEYQEQVKNIMVAQFGVDMVEKFFGKGKASNTNANY